MCWACVGVGFGRAGRREGIEDVGRGDRDASRTAEGRRGAHRVLSSNAVRLSRLSRVQKERERREIVASPGRFPTRNSAFPDRGKRVSRPFSVAANA